MPAGYSGKPLAAKLGFKPGMNVIFINPPESYPKDLGKLPDAITIKKRLAGSFDLIHVFVTREADLLKRLPALAKAIADKGMLWISWPKGTSSMETDLNGNIVRSTVLKNQKTLVDIKVCAVDEDWSGLKFVFRRKQQGR